MTYAIMFNMIVACVLLVVIAYRLVRNVVIEKRELQQQVQDMYNENEFLTEQIKRLSQHE